MTEIRLEGASPEVPRELWEPKLRAALVGGELAQVIFVRDYVQLGFEAPWVTVSALVHPRIGRGSTWSAWSDPGFGNALRDCIGARVSRLDLVPEERFDLELDNGVTLRVSLRAEDRVVPEAVTVDMDGEGWLVL